MKITDININNLIAYALIKYKAFPMIDEEYLRDFFVSNLKLQTEFYTDSESEYIEEILDCFDNLHDFEMLEQTLPEPTFFYDHYKGTRYFKLDIIKPYRDYDIDNLSLAQAKELPSKDVFDARIDSDEPTITKDIRIYPKGDRNIFINLSPKTLMMYFQVKSGIWIRNFSEFHGTVTIDGETIKRFNPVVINRD